MIHKIIFWIRDWWQGKPTCCFRGGGRDSRWRHVRNEHVKKEPCCQWCGGKSRLEVHHVKPFHIFPEAELNPENLITLCESWNNCHLKVGHNGSWKRWNPDVRQECNEHRNKVV